MKLFSFGLFGDPVKMSFRANQKALYRAISIQDINGYQRALISGAELFAEDGKAIRQLVTLPSPQFAMYALMPVRYDQRFKSIFSSLICQSLLANDIEKLDPLIELMGVFVLGRSVLTDWDAEKNRTEAERDMSIYRDNVVALIVKEGAVMYERVKSLLNKQNSFMANIVVQMENVIIPLVKLDPNGMGRYAIEDVPNSQSIMNVFLDIALALVRFGDRFLFARFVEYAEQPYSRQAEEFNELNGVNLLVVVDEAVKEKQYAMARWLVTRYRYSKNGKKKHPYFRLISENIAIRFLKESSVGGDTSGFVFNIVDRHINYHQEKGLMRPEQLMLLSPEWLKPYYMRWILA